MNDNNSSRGNKIEENPDVVLICGRHRFPCRRDALSDCSPYFKAMFTLPLVESSADEITLHDVVPNALKCLLTYVYTKKFQANDKNVYTTLEAACMFQFDSIKQNCVDYLLSTININKCLKIMSYGNLFGIESLYRPARQMALWDFCRVVETKEFLQMDVHATENYLSNDGLRLNSEMDVFDSIVEWIEHDCDGRREFLKRLLQTIRFRDLSLGQLNVMLRNNNVKQDDECVELLTEIKTLKLQENKKNKCEVNMEEESRLGKKLMQIANRVVPRVPIVISDSTPCFVYLNKDKKEIIRLANVSKVASNGHVAIGFRACAIGHHIYVMGGEFYLGCSNWNDAMWSFDTFTNSWSFVTNLPSNRRHHCICTLDDCIYLIGGIGKYRIMMKDVDKFDTKTEEWKSLAPIPVSVYSSACTSHERKIYVLLFQVYYYDPKSNNWTVMRRSELPNEHGFHSALPHPKGIYLIGHHSLDLILYYTCCDDRSDNKKAYAVVGRFTYPTSNACIVGDVIYSFGCKNDALIVESYDIVSDTFSIVCEGWKGFEGPRLSNGCFTIPMY